MHNPSTIKPPSPAQWKYLDGLAAKLGHPHAKSLCADLLGQRDWVALHLDSKLATACIAAANVRLQNLMGKGEGKEGVRGRYG